MNLSDGVNTGWHPVSQCHASEGWHPVPLSNWTPASAGVTIQCHASEGWHPVPLSDWTPASAGVIVQCHASEGWHPVPLSDWTPASAGVTVQSHASEGWHPVPLSDWTPASAGVTVQSHASEGWHPVPLLDWTPASAGVTVQCHASEGWHPVIFFCLWLFSPLLWALTPYTATYTLLWHGIPMGSSVQTLQEPTPHQFVLDVTAEPYLGFLPYDYEEHAIFTVEKQEILPQQYHYAHHEGRKRKIGTLQFDWTKQVLYLPNNTTVPLLPHTQDKITHLFALQRDLASKSVDQLIRGFVLSYPVAEKEGIVPYTFQIESVEPLKTALGTFKAVQLSHTSGKRTTLLWLDTQHNYRLLKIQQFRKGKLLGGGEIRSFED